MHNIAWQKLASVWTATGDSVTLKLPCSNERTGTVLHVGTMCAWNNCLSMRACLRCAARGDLLLTRSKHHLGNRALSVAGPAA